ncbi:hypothetical protein P3S68_029976 [Capsicum galapagoense]
MNSQNRGRIMWSLGLSVVLSSPFCHRCIGAFIQRSSMEDQKFRTPYDSINVGRDSWSREIREIRSLLQELIGNPARSKPTPAEFPRFCGENPKLWISRAERYFDFYEITKENKLSLASCYLDGAALSWYQWLFRNKQLVDWKHFTTKVLIRFPKQHLESLKICCRHLILSLPDITFTHFSLSYRVPSTI